MYFSIILFTLFTSGFCYVVPIVDYAENEPIALYRIRRSVNVFNPIDYDVVALDDNVNQHENDVHVRHVRQIFGNLTPGNPGAIGTVGVRGNLFNDNLRSLSGSAQVSRNFFPSSPTSVAGGLQYQAPKTSASVDVNHTRHFGTGVGATVEHNLYKGRNDNLNAFGSYNQHFGGPGPRTPPNVNVGLKYNF